MTMTSPAVVFLHLALFSALHLPLPLPPVSACPDLPSITVEDACRKATATLLMYELCKDALRDVSLPSSGADLYALVAAKRALASFGDTAGAADALRRNETLPGDEMAAYALCWESYGGATDRMDTVADALVDCRFSRDDGDLGQVYRDAIAQVESCRNQVLKLPSSPLYAMVLVDRNLAVLAYFLGRLLGVQ